MTMANINGYAMHYLDCGTGTAILFIHPPVLTSLNFTYQLQGLSSNYRTVAFDIRGHGKSQASHQPVTYPLIAEDIEELLNHLKIDKCYLCGYSTGGSVVLDFLLTYPDRAWGGILVGGMSEVNERWLRNRILSGVVFSRLGAVGLIALADAWSQTNQPSFLFDLYYDARRGNAKNVEQYYSYSLTYNCTSRLQSIHTPVLLVYGEKDSHFHPYARMLHQRLPRSELVIVKNLDHRIPTKAPDLLNERIKQFISSTGPIVYKNGMIGDSICILRLS
jgi:pimeloyl-ACP methyl ester carboxylesterase